MKTPAGAAVIRNRLAGTPGQLVDECPEGLTFGPKKARQSPYDPLLLQLRAAGAGKYLKFESLAARIAVQARARKLKIPVLFGEHGSVLYVSLGAAELTTEGVAEAAEPKKSNADVVLEAVKAGKRQAGEILTHVRTRGIPGASLSLIDQLLSNLMRTGLLKLRSQKPGYDGPDVFEIK